MSTILCRLPFGFLLIFILYLFYLIFGDSDWSYYLLSQIFVVTSLFFVWKFSNEIFDQNADFNSSNYTFTAPVTGRYLLTTHVMVEAVDTAASYYQLKIHTSNRIHYATEDYRGLSSDPDYKCLDIICICDMDANDTVSTSLRIDGGSRVVDIDDIGSAGIIKIACADRFLKINILH